jgi:hypothetical protein
MGRRQLVVGLQKVNPRTNSARSKLLTYGPFIEEKWWEGKRREVKHQKLNPATENLSTPPFLPTLNRYPIGQTAQKDTIVYLNFGY